jgi:hypothetical protein
VTSIGSVASGREPRMVVVDDESNLARVHREAAL